MKKFFIWCLLAGVSTLCQILALPAEMHAETTSASGATLINPSGTGVYTMTSAFIITTPGTYYLSRDVVFTGSAPYAIQIYPPANNVTIDLNGHTLSTYPSGQSGNLAVTSYGIASYSCSNMTVRNGTISGFLYGVLSNDTNTSGHRIENVRLSNDTVAGAYINGSNSIMRSCLVINTGGSTVSGASECEAIAMNGASNRIIDCDVAKVTTSNTSGCIVAGIVMSNASDGVVLNNRITQTPIGIRFKDVNSTVKYRDNLLGASVATQISGTGIDAGGNF